MNILKSTCYTLLTSLLFLGSASANTTYIVQEGDTAKKIAKAYLGSEEASSALLSHNKLPAANDLKPGTVLSLPTGLNQQPDNLNVLVNADLKAAKLAQADVYAATEFNALSSKVAEAEAANKSGKLERARTLLVEMPSLRDNAINAANKNAIVPGQASIARSSGTIEISSDNGINWNVIDATSVLRKGDRIRSQEASKAVLTFPNGIEIEMDPLSAFKVVALEFDKRDSAHDIKLRLLLGEILGKMKPMERKKPLKIESGRASIAVRGSTVLAGSGPVGVLRGSNFAGEMDIEMNGNVVVFEPGEGVVASPDGLLGPVKLPAAPVLVGAHAGNFTTGSPKVHFDVDTQTPEAASRHKLEVSKDAQFIDIAHSHIGYGDRLETPDLDQGTYFYRVAALDDNNLQGPQFAQGSFEIVEAPAVTVDTKAPHREANGMLIVGKGVTYQAAIEGGGGEVEWIVNDELIASPDGSLMLDEDGFYEMKVSAAGGDAGAERLSVYVDAKGPAIRVHLSDPFGNPAIDAAVRGLTILGEDTTGVGSLSASVNGGPSEPIGELPLVLDASVANRVEIEATDLWGNRSSRSVDVPAANIRLVPQVQDRPPMRTVVREPVMSRRPVPPTPAVMPAPAIPAPVASERVLVPEARGGNWFQRFLGITPKERVPMNAGPAMPSGQIMPAAGQIPVSQPVRQVAPVRALPSAPYNSVPTSVSNPLQTSRVIMPETKKTPFLNRIFAPRNHSTRGKPSMVVETGTATGVSAGPTTMTGSFQTEPIRQFAPNGVPLARVYPAGGTSMPVISRPNTSPVSTSSVAAPPGPPVIQTLPIPPGFKRSSLGGLGQLGGRSSSAASSTRVIQSNGSAAPPVIQTLPLPANFRRSSVSPSSSGSPVLPSSPARPVNFSPAPDQSVPVLQPVIAPKTMPIPSVNIPSPTVVNPLGSAPGALNPLASPPPPVAIPAPPPVTGAPASVPFGEREIIPEPASGSGKTLLERLLKE